MSKQLHYGVITDDKLSLRGPKMVDKGPFTSLREAFNEAVDYILTDTDGFAKVVVCKPEDPNDPIWVEDLNYAVMIPACGEPFITDQGVFGGGETDIANAQLIAAAPDLLVALEQCVPLIIAHANYSGEGVSTLQVARLAIAQAKHKKSEPKKK